jgi:hypothetical protein
MSKEIREFSLVPGRNNIINIPKGGVVLRLDSDSLMMFTEIDTKEKILEPREFVVQASWLQLENFISIDEVGLYVGSTFTDSVYHVYEIIKK